MIVERLGNFNRVIARGFHFIIPYLEEPRKVKFHSPYNESTGQLSPTFIYQDRFKLSEYLYDLTTFELFTKEKIKIKIENIISFKVIEPRKFVYEIQRS